MGENGIGNANVAAMHAAINAVQALGRGFDVNFDTRLLYCKGVAGAGVVEIDEEHTRELYLYDSIAVPNVSRDITNSLDSVDRQSFGPSTFHEMVEYFNRKAHISADFPIGSFNCAFSFTGSKPIDAAATKTLSMDGFYIPLSKVQLVKLPPVLRANVKLAVPNCWDPSSLASFIENFGTHVIASVTIGGKDEIYIKQHPTSPLSTTEIKNYVQEIGNQRFAQMDSCNSGLMKIKEKGGDSGIFNSQGIYPQPTSVPYLTGKEDFTVIFRRRGGDDLEQSHSRWLSTVRSSPDVIGMTFVPITDLLVGAPGKEHLTRAVGLYLECKKP
uniref:MACPF domain-containing protein CAD1-like isoform X2 n=1 Tax=Rhizophora mucronata TaxID=61149 RepID=A0A2P2KZY3_RHIMU